MTEALVLLKRFCGALYGAHDVEAAMNCLSDDALVTGFHGQARGEGEISRILREGAAVSSAPRSLDFFDERGEALAEGVSEAALSVAAENGFVPRRLYCTALERDGETRIRTLRAELSEDQAAREQSARLIDLVRNLSCGVAVCRVDRDDRLTIQYLNDGYFALMEEEREKLSARYDANIVSGIHAEDRAMVQAHLDDLTRTRRGHEMTYRYITSRGKLKWIHVKTKAVKHEDGTATSYSTYTDLTERMALEQKLTAMTETVPCGVCLYRRDGDALIPLLYNGRYCDMLGARAAEPFSLTKGVGARCRFDDDRDALEEAARLIAAGENQVTFEARANGKDGDKRWLRLRLTAVAPSGAGEAMTLCVVERIDVEKELRRRYEMERTKPRLGENCLLAYALINLSAGETVEYVQWDGTPAPSSERLLLSEGLQNAETLLIDDEERREFLELHDAQGLLDRFARGETEFSMDYRRRMTGGDIIWVRNILRLMRAPDSSDVLLFEYRYDIDDEKNAEISYQRLTSRAYDFIARVCLDSGRYSYRVRSNDPRSVPSVRGEDAEAMFGRLIDAHVHPDDRETARRFISPARVRDMLAQSDSFAFSCRAVDAGGAVKYKHVSGFYLDRQRDLAIVTCEDVTPLVREETRKNELLTGALETARKAERARGQFLSRMSHELRTPMNAVIGLSSLIEGDAGNASAVLDAARKIGSSAKYLLSLINDILEMTNIESGHVVLREDAFTFDELLDDVRAVACGQIAAKQIDYRIDLNGLGGERLIGDREKLRQILVHILGNAVKFTPACGRIDLIAEQLRRRGDRADIRLTVADTGVGIDPAFLPHVFEPFSQETICFAPETAGTGLGLTIARHLINMMNGQIEVRSVKGRGTTVIMEAALGVPSAPPSAARGQEKRADLTGRRVLIAEDHPINAEVVRRLLEKSGAQTVVTVNGLEALEAFRRSEEYAFDAVLMDIQMPVMDGLTAAKSIRALKRADSACVPIIALTANTFNEDKERSLACGMDAHIAKPIEPDTLFSALLSLIRPRGGAQR